MLTIAHLLAHCFETSPEAIKFCTLYSTQLRKDKKWLDKNVEDQDAYLSAMLDNEGWWSAKIRINGEWSTIKFQLAKEKQ